MGATCHDNTSELVVDGSSDLHHHNGRATTTRFLTEDDQEESSSGQVDSPDSSGEEDETVPVPVPAPPAKKQRKSRQQRATPDPSVATPPAPATTTTTKKRTLTEQQKENLAAGRAKALLSRREKAKALRDMEIRELCVSAATEALLRSRSVEPESQAPSKPLPAQGKKGSKRAPVQGSARKVPKKASTRRIGGTSRELEQREADALQAPAAYDVGDYSVHPHLLKSPF